MVIVLMDAILGQMVEPLQRETLDLGPVPEKDWALKGRGDGPSKYICSLILDTLDMERHNWKLDRKYKEIEEKEVQYEAYKIDDAEIIVIAYEICRLINPGLILSSKRAR